MAKQTNKTNHILNLLSGNGKKKESSEEHNAGNTAPPVVPKSKVKENAEQHESVEHVEAEPQVVVDVVDEKAEVKENEELVSNINSALEEELKEYEETRAAELSKEAITPVDDTTEDVTVGSDKGLSQDEINVLLGMDQEETSNDLEKGHEDKLLEEQVSDLSSKEIFDDNFEESANYDLEGDFGILFNGPSILAENPKADLEDVIVEEEPIPNEELEMEKSTDSSAGLSQDEINNLIEETEEGPVLNEELIPYEEKTSVDIEDEEFSLEGKNHEDIDNDNVIDEQKKVEEPAENKELETTEQLEKAVELEETAVPADLGKDGAEPGYVTLNVMETLVDMMALEYMEKFKICTCDRCIADVKALALTKLAGKYVVVDKDAVQPMINFYEKKFKSDVTVELTKACITIDENPHH